MRKILATLLLIPFLFLPVAAQKPLAKDGSSLLLHTDSEGALIYSTVETDWSAVIKQVEKALVYIEIEDSGCSGFVVDITRKYVQTAAHCFASEIWADRVSAKVISKDSQEDLMILEVKDLDPARTALKLADDNPNMGLEVMSAGYGYALRRPFFRKSMVSDNAVMIPEVGGPFIGVDSGFIGGQSGGPVVNAQGEVVAIVQMASDKLGIGVGAKVIKERMGRFYQK